MAKKVKETKREPRFTKNQILAAAKYNHRRDALSAILVDGESYTIKEVNSLLEKFMKGKVN